MPRISSRNATCWSWKSRKNFLVTRSMSRADCSRLRHLDDADISLGVEIGEVKYHLAELAEKKIARLAFEEQVVARKLLALLAFDPVPEALGSLAVHKDQQVLMVQLGDFLVNCGPGLGIRDRAVVRLDLQNNRPAKLGDVAAIKVSVLDELPRMEFCGPVGTSPAR